MEVDQFCSIGDHSRTSLSQEERLRRCSFAFEAEDVSSEEPQSSNSSGIPFQCTGIVMLSLPESDDENNARNEGFQTPPEGSILASGSEEQPPVALHQTTDFGGDTMVTDLDGGETVDLGKDSAELGFSEVELGQRREADSEAVPSRRVNEFNENEFLDSGLKESGGLTRKLSPAEDSKGFVESNLKRVKISGELVRPKSPLFPLGAVEGTTKERLETFGEDSMAAGEAHCELNASQDTEAGEKLCEERSAKNMDVNCDTEVFKSEFESAGISWSGEDNAKKDLASKEAGEDMEDEENRGEQCVGEGESAKMTIQDNRKGDLVSKEAEKDMQAEKNRLPRCDPKSESTMRNIEDIHKFSYTGGRVDFPQRKGKYRAQRVLPLSIHTPADNALGGFPPQVHSGEVCNEEEKEITLLDVLRMIARENGEEHRASLAKVNFEKTAESCGLHFPRPRWWPERGFTISVDDDEN